MRLFVFLACICALFASAQPSAALAAPTHYPLIFARSTPAARDSARLLLVGDVSFARGVAAFAERNGAQAPLQQVAPLIQAADYAVGNYEGVIAADGVGERREGAYRLRAVPEAAAQLAAAGFDAFSLANNHSYDYGAEGLAATQAHLNAAGINEFGVADSEYIVEVRGVRLAWLAFTLVPDPPDAPDARRNWLSPADQPRLTAAVRAARADADVVIVLLHWGAEYDLCHAAWQAALARAAVENGAALVVGHHSHVVGQYEVYQDGLIAYSLGNFLFDQERRAGLALWVTVDRDGLAEVRALGVDAAVQPTWYDPARSALSLRGKVLLAETPAAAYSLSDGALQVFPFAAGSLPSAPCREDRTPRLVGRVDLRGDGDPERVEIADGVLRVYKGEQLVWQSYDQWWVADAALGDPNWDGREEVALLFWKQDALNAPITTHPHLLGYRGGQYQIVWGGSDPRRWLEALAIADLDGDGNPELIAIERDFEALPHQARYRVAVSAWHGWGFVQRWFSAYGTHTRLVPFRTTEGLWRVAALTH
ncbi:MAG: CapA family protein [Chloroflexi bacterium CFX4]|nr:CapA family protein [Chloroflexi bacterium CFX4]MDL1922982.1 CapA family protein [Chloroflexi bacterium CFX3]